MAEKQCGEISRSRDILDSFHLSLLLSPCSTEGMEVRNSFLGTGAVLDACKAGATGAVLAVGSVTDAVPG